MRTENDFIGNLDIPDNALYGIHSLRAKNNFPIEVPFQIEWYKAVGITKLACYITYENFKIAALKKYKSSDILINFFDEEVITVLKRSAEEVAEGKYFENFIVPAIQGGAGTSINLNINEIIANSSLQKLNKKLGDYKIIDPIEHANIYQSTNDVIPTALKVATIGLLEKLEDRINKLRFEIEKQENKHRNTLRIAYTQMQEAVPSSYGKLFSTYNDALSRDWWRVSKCFERIKIVNLGGSAVGTSLAVPRYFVMEVVQNLQKLTKIPITKSENLNDATNNLDSFVEVHAILKSHAVNLEKIVSDIRLISSELINNKEVSIPKMQVGSSIMPSKVNPVIPEFVVSAAHKIYSNDLLISNLSAQGNLELNAYLPIIGNALLESIKLLIAANKTLEENLISGIEIDVSIAKEKLFNSPSITTALSPYIGYNKASELSNEMRKNNCNVFEANKKLNLIAQQKLETVLQTQNLLKAGFSLNDLLK